MNLYFLSAGILTFGLVITHSILGEVLIFRYLRNIKFEIPEWYFLLNRQKVNLLRTSWHSITIFGIGFAMILIRMALPEARQVCFERLITITFLFSNFYWLIGTKGKHPAWIVLFTITILTILG
jgi:hypothetical protein